MPELHAAMLELGERAPVRTRRVAFAGVAQLRFGGDYLQHLLGIGFPVRGAVQVATVGQVGDQLAHELGLNQPPLVVALLVPGIREVDVHSRQ